VLPIVALQLLIHCKCDLLVSCWCWGNSRCQAVLSWPLHTDPQVHAVYESILDVDQFAVHVLESQVWVWSWRHLVKHHKHKWRVRTSTTVKHTLCLHLCPCQHAAVLSPIPAYQPLITWQLLDLWLLVQVKSLPQILLSIPEDKLVRMQRRIARVWHR
jgi:hypothetical protein